jgi:hypothetical protein
MQFKEFRSTKGDLHLSSTSGHMAVISTEFTPIPDVLWADAYIQGAIASDTNVDSLDSFVQEKKEEQRIQEMLEREEVKLTLQTIFTNPVGFLDSKNNLVIRKVVSLLGKPIKREVIESVWEEVVAESEV